MSGFLKRLVPGSSRSGIDEAVHENAEGINIITFPGIRPVQNHPLFGSQFKSRCAALSC